MVASKVCNPQVINIHQPLLGQFHSYLGAFRIPHYCGLLSTCSKCPTVRSLLPEVRSDGTGFVIYINAVLVFGVDCFKVEEGLNQQWFVGILSKYHWLCAYAPMYLSHFLVLQSGMVHKFDGMCGLGCPVKDGKDMITWIIIQKKTCIATYCSIETYNNVQITSVWL